MAKTRKNMKRSNNKNRNKNNNKKRLLKRRTNKIYKGGFYYTKCKPDDIEEKYQVMIRNKDWSGLKKLYDECCPQVNLGKMGVFNKVKGIKNQTRQCKLIEERMNEAWEKTNRQSGPILRGSTNEMDDSPGDEEEYEPVMPSPQPIDKYGRTIQPQSSSGCIIS
jgi:hypothetical protein